jgi:amino acid transporter
MAPNYAEEARNPKKMMAYATYISCIGLAIVYTFWAWMLVSSYGSSHNQWVWAVALNEGHKTAVPASVGLPALATHNYASVYYPVAQDFVGKWLKDLFEIFIITGSFACSLAFWNTSNRYLYSIGRENILPRVLGRTHSKHKSPFAATLFVAVFCIIFTALFATGLVGGGERHALGIPTSSPLTALLQIGTWLPYQGNMLLFPIMALCSVAIMIYFVRTRDGFHPFKTLVAPILAAATIIFAVYLMVKNRSTLFGTTTGWYGASPWIAVGVFAGGCLLGLAFYQWSRHRYDAVGKFLHEEA